MKTLERINEGYAAVCLPTAINFLVTPPEYRLVSAGALNKVAGRAIFRRFHAEFSPREETACRLPHGRGQAPPLR